MEKQIFLDFTRRTDEIASRLKVRLEDLPAKLEVSRASFFAYRSGKSPVSNKAWLKLERAERESGISPPIARQLASAGPDEQTALIASASLEEILSLLPADKRAQLAADFLDANIKSIERQIQGFFLDAQSLAGLVMQKKASRSELRFFARTVNKSLEPCRKAWQLIVEQLRDALRLADPKSLAKRLPWGPGAKPTGKSSKSARKQQSRKKRH